MGSLRHSFCTKKGFTLIELLVVIAIIAILAAILFPVFAQAKKSAQKAVTITQAQETGLSIIMYTSDNDDLGPTGTVPNLSNPGVIQYRPGDAAAQDPAGWFNYPLAQDEYALVWNNSTFPYRKNGPVMNPPGNTQVNITSDPWPAGYASPLQKPQGSNFTYNGLLQGYSMTAITSPSMLPLLWQGIGNITRVGAAMANPRLNCAGTGPCTYNPGGEPQAGMTSASGSYFNILLGGTSYTTFAKGNVYVMADGHAQLVILGTGNQASYPMSTESLDPLQFINDDGTVTQNYIRGCVVSSNPYVYYVAAFVPTNDFAGHCN